MAIGPGIYREKYKDYSIDELKTTLKELKKYLHSKELKKARREEIEKGIDDNNCVTNVETEIKVVKDLINCKGGKNFIRKTKLDENGMEYEEEEYFEMSNIEEEAKKFTLINLIKKNAGLDPFWADCFINFFNQVNKTENEKLEFFKKLILDKNLFNNLSKDILKTSNSDELFENYKMNLNITKDKISNEELKKIVEEIIGNNDPFWNQPIYEIVKKIINLSVGEESSITKLLGDSQFTSKQLFDIYYCVNKVCRKIGIILDFSSENAKVNGLLYNLPFKKYYIGNTKSSEKCLCGNNLEIIWNDNQKFQMVRCPKCNNEMKFKNPNLN